MKLETNLPAVRIFLIDRQHSKANSVITHTIYEKNILFLIQGNKSVSITNRRKDLFQLSDSKHAETEQAELKSKPSSPTCKTCPGFDIASWKHASSLNCRPGPFCRWMSIINHHSLVCTTSVPPRSTAQPD